MYIGMGAGSLRAHFLDRFGRKFWIASGGRSGRKLLTSAGVVLGSTGVVLCSTGVVWSSTL